MSNQRVTFYMTQNDTGPPRDFIISRSGTAVDLAGYNAIDFVIVNPETKAITNTGHQACTKEDSAKGRARYNFLAGDLPVAGNYLCDLRLTDTAGKVETLYEYVEIIVRAQAQSV